MFRAGKWAAFAVVVAVVALAWAGFSLTAQEPKPIDASALREAIETASKRGENVDEVRKALAAFEKALPTIKPGRVPPELQALRDAVDAAAKKGENVDAVAKELVAVEMAIAGRSLAKPKTEPRPDLPPNRFNPPNPGAFPFPVVPFPANPGGGVDVEAFQKAMELRMKAMDLMAKNPRDPEALKLAAEANELLMKAIRNGGPMGGIGIGGLPAFPDIGRIPDRARLGIRLEKIAAATADQLGLEPNVGIVVTGVVAGSVAEKAGLKTHDIILEFAGKAVTDDTEDFIRRVNAAKTGEKIDLVVMRKGKKVEVKGVVLPEADRQPALPRPVVPFPALPGLLPELPKANPVPLRVAPPPLPPVPQVVPVPVPGVVDAPFLVRAASEPKNAKPELSELRYAATAADKRGENVEAILDALTAFEKAMAKGFAAPQAGAPPELTALREAVEAAAKKGENVEAIAKELALIEKAITGREYERPKPPAPKPEPVRPFPPRRGGVVVGGGGGIVINGNGFNATSVTITNGNYTIRAKQGDVTYSVTGSTADATVMPKITIQDGEKKIETDDVKKVPEEYRPTVERLLKTVTRG